MGSERASSNSHQLQQGKLCADMSDELFTRWMGMWWRRPKAGSWTTGPPEIASKPQYSMTLSCQYSPRDRIHCHREPLFISHPARTSQVFPLPCALQGLVLATMRSGYKSGGLLSALCATLGWGRGALKRKLSICWKRSTKQRIWSILNIAYVCKKRTVLRDPRPLA